MTDYISREDALGSICIDCSAQRDCRPDERCADYERIKNIPAADVQEVKRGKWIGGELGHCSRCGHEGCASDIWNTGDIRYCPNCGARMEASRED